MEFPIITINKNDPNYSKRLANIPDPPKKIFCRGNIKLLSSDCLAIVGTRKLTNYGKEAARLMTTEIASAGFTVVSGLAFGIDSVAHQTTLDVGGKTITVLGGGIDDESIGPKTNFSLAQRILKNKGLLVSEYEPKSKIYPINFAVRDRIISGLSLGVVVIEADVDSGSLITAQCALDQNRDVFAIPGSIFSRQSNGTNELIKNGAKLVASPKDILEEYGKNISLFDNKKQRLSTEDPVQQAILAILDTRGESSLDILSAESGTNISKIMSAVSILELNGLITRNGQGKYRKS